MELCPGSFDKDQLQGIEEVGDGGGAAPFLDFGLFFLSSGWMLQIMRGLRQIMPGGLCLPQIVLWSIDQRQVFSHQLQDVAT